MSPLFMPSPEETMTGQNPVIKVIGVGGAGGNAINHMITQGLRNVEYIAVNTDQKALKKCQASDCLQLGERGTGAGTNPDVAKEMAIKSRDELSERLHGTDMVFITAGMGGGTGSGAAPIIAELAKDIGVLSVAVVTYPFSNEGPVKQKIAQNSILELEASVNALIVVHNDKLKKELPEKVKMKQAFAAADNVLYNAVSGVSDIINETGYMQVDFADVCTVMLHAGISMMGSAITEGENRAEQAIEKALQSPFLEGVELKNANGVLLYIAASEDSLELDEFDFILSRAKQCASDQAIIKAGLIYDEKLGDKMKVTVLITGLGHTTQNDSPDPLLHRESDSLPREDTHGNRIYPNYTPYPKNDRPTSMESLIKPSLSTFLPPNSHQNDLKAEPEHDSPKLPSPIGEILNNVIRPNKIRKSEKKSKEAGSSSQQLPLFSDDHDPKDYSETRKDSDRTRIPRTLHKIKDI